MMSKTMQLAIGSVGVGLLVFGLKMLAWGMTGSVALFSDALESTVNVATALVALFAVQLAAKPADVTHPYGHHKAEFFSAVLEGVMIIVAALLILHEAYQALWAPRMMDAPWQGLMLNALASGVNGLWCWVLIRYGRQLRSPALVADGKHLLTDVVSSVGVVLGLVLAIALGWLWLDALLALIVALNILWAGWEVMQSSLSGLMDESVPPKQLAEIKALIAREAQGAIEAHDLRTRHAGRATFIDFHLVVPGVTTVAESHALCDRIEQALMAVVPDACITIHVEPESMAQHKGVVVI